MRSLQPIVSSSEMQRARRESALTTHEDYTIDTPWVLQDALYQGRFVTVYRALWRHMNVCVKEIRLEESGDTDMRRTFDRELTVLAKCIHPRICQFLGARMEGKNGYMVFEYMDQGDLRKYIRDNPSLEASRRIALVKDVALAILYLHDRRPNAVMHRDLKPDNVLVARDGTAKVADFGISRLIDNFAGTEQLWGDTHTGEVGTYTWMAPEVANSKRYGIASDVYSLGLIIYFVWTGTVPFSQYPKTAAFGIQLLMRKIENTAVLNTIDIHDPDILQLCLECTQYDPELRPSAEYVVQKIMSIQESTPP